MAQHIETITNRVSKFENLQKHQPPAEVQQSHRLWRRSIVDFLAEETILATWWDVCVLAAVMEEEGRGDHHEHVVDDDDVLDLVGLAVLHEPWPQHLDCVHVARNDRPDGEGTAHQWPVGHTRVWNRKSNKCYNNLDNATTRCITSFGQGPVVEASDAAQNRSHRVVTSNVGHNRKKSFPLAEFVYRNHQNTTRWPQPSLATTKRRSKL